MKYAILRASAAHATEMNRRRHDERPMSALTMPIDLVVTALEQERARCRNVRDRVALLAEKRYLEGL